MNHVHLHGCYLATFGLNISATYLRTTNYGMMWHDHMIQAFPQMLYIACREYAQKGMYGSYIIWDWETNNTLQIIG